MGLMKTLNSVTEPLDCLIIYNNEWPCLWLIIAYILLACDLISYILIYVKLGSFSPIIC
ncbi:hypothetical protein LOK49_LG08G01337 [Camellia lanceoleosa]|uniref:Uncharacterized protein n=1 Tax=Camellia lanceoleosa TaxID=1840588 RepID=A0ACC0GX40_9ERIC|nr:hypothetical protein LOK49_LG08G01337 [Camellia lanceoleosa]